MVTLDPRMGAFDAVMWGVEGDPVLRSVITVVIMLDEEPDVAAFRQRIDRVTRLNPKLRQRAVGNPVSMIPPRWETDPNFDLGYHVRWQRLPRRGAGLREVLTLAERISEQDFDRMRPLWEMTFVTGLSKGQAALIIKLHHAITDGIGAMTLAAGVLDLDRKPKLDLGPMPPPPEPHEASLADRMTQGLEFEVQSAQDQVSELVSSVADLAGKVVSDPISSAVAGREWMSSAARMLAPASEPMSPVLTNRSLSVAFDVIEVELDALKRAGKAGGCTLNDAYMAAVTGGLRLYHERHGDSVPDGVRVNMPISVRSEGDDPGGNRWVPARFVIPLNEADPMRRMHQLHPILLQAREEPALGLSGTVYQLLATLPNPITTSIAGSLMKGTDIAATNVPGPPFPLYLCGAKVTAIIPFAPKGGAAINVGLMSYSGIAFVGINSDLAAVEDPDELTDCFVQAFADVVALGEPESKE